MARNFDALIEEAVRAPVEGWDFSWLEGRATEERPPWGYSRLLAERASQFDSMLDVETGGGELLFQLPTLPNLTVATEAWRPNVGLAATRLRRRGAWVVEANDDTLPFGDATFELVTSRHPVAPHWEEIARVLVPGGRYLSQQIGPRSMRELTEFFLGPQAAPSARTPELTRASAEAAGLRVERLESARLRATFSDIGAVVYFLRLVVWTVPDFSVDKYKERLRALHEQIEAEGVFVAHPTRLLVEAAKAGPEDRGG